MNEEARDVKLNFWQILFSPFISLKNMVSSGPEVENDIELNIDSTNKQEAALAKSLEKVDSEVQNYGNEQLISKKVEEKKSHRKIVEETRVSEEQLNKAPKTQTKKVQKEQDLEIGEK